MRNAVGLDGIGFAIFPHLALWVLVVESLPFLGWR